MGCVMGPKKWIGAVFIVEIHQRIPRQHFNNFSEHDLIVFRGNGVNSEALPLLIDRCEQQLPFTPHISTLLLHLKDGHGFETTSSER